MKFVETVKIDDPRLDESFSFIFVFRKGDVVVSRENRALRGQINDGVYVGEFPTERREPSIRRVRRYTKSSFQTRYCKSSMKRRSKKLVGVKGLGDRLLALTADFSK